MQEFAVTPARPASKYYTLAIYFSFGVPGPVTLIISLNRCIWYNGFMIEFIAKNDEIELKSYSPEATLAGLAESLETFRLSCGLKTAVCKGCGECCSDNIPVLGADLRVLEAGLKVSEAEPPAPEAGLEAPEAGSWMHEAEPWTPETGPHVPQSSLRLRGADTSTGSRKVAAQLLTLPEKPDIAARRKAIREMSAAAGITQLEAILLYEYNNAEPIILKKQESGECCFLKNRLCSRYTIRPYSCGLYLCDMGEKLSYLQEMVIRQGTWHAYYKLGWVQKEDISHNPFLKSESYDELLVSDFDFHLENTLEQLFFYF